MRFNSLALIAIGSALAANASAQTVPPPPLTIHQYGAAQCQSTVKGYRRATVHDHQTQTYGPQAGFVILNYNVYDTGSFGTETENYTSQPAGVYVSNTNFTNTFNSAFSLVASSSANGNLFGLSASGASDINAALTNAYNAYFAYNVALASSFGHFTLETDAYGNGICVSTGSSCGLKLDVTLIQIDPCMLSNTAFNNFVMNWTKSTIRAFKSNPANWQTMLCSLYAAPVRQLCAMSNQSTTHFISKQLASVANESAKLMGWKPILLGGNGKRGPFSVGPDEGQDFVGLGRFRPAPGPEWLNQDEVRTKIKEDLARLAADGRD